MDYTFDAAFVRKYIGEFCARYDYPAEATETFLSVFDRVCEDKELSEKFFAPVREYAAGSKKFKYGSHLSGGEKKGKGGECKLVADKLGVSTYTTDFLYCLCLIPYLEKLYEEKGLDKQIFYDGMIDFKCKLWECKKVYDVWGSFVAGWFGGWFTLGRFQFGRLQYEPAKGIWICCKLSGGKRVRLWQKFLNMHIPSMGPLRPEEVEASFRAAYPFFRARGYGKDIVYHTSSWLLSPDHRKMFKPDSNIVRFMDCFKVVAVYNEKDNNDFWRIYDRPYNAENPDCSGSTTMQKEYAKLILSGGHIKHGSGVFVFDGDRFYK